jgi:uncharacterized protein YeaO (DUF488 family)
VEWQQKYAEFTKEYTAELNKKLQEIKQSAFTDSEQEK